MLDKWLKKCCAASKYIHFGGAAYEIFTICKKTCYLNILSKWSKDKEDFVKRPFRDFSRNTKLSFQNTIMSLISMERSSITSELQKFFNFSVDTPTSSAFVQQRDKLLPVAFQHLFYAFSKEFPSGNIMDLIYLL